MVHSDHLNITKAAFAQRLVLCHVLFFVYTGDAVWHDIEKYAKKEGKFRSAMGQWDAIWYKAFWINICYLWANIFSSAHS